MSQYSFPYFAAALTIATASGLLLCSAGAAAQASPSTSEMIDQLKTQPGPRTRSMRNLIVESATARPALSLLVQFDFNSARIKGESRQALVNLSEALQSSELASARFAIEGHTDAKGRADYNLKLSQQRADSVRDLLARQGVAASRLTAVGKGSSEPANESDPQASENRRVRIVNLN